MNSNPTQRKRILDYMLTNGGITQFEALRDLGVMCLGARIFELKRMGHKINARMVTVENRYGEKCRVKRYAINNEGDGNGGN